MGKYSKAFSIKKQFQSPNCQTCQGQSRTMKKFIFLELFLRIIEDEKWNLFVKLGQLRTPILRDCEIFANLHTLDSITSPVPECGDVVPRPVQQGPHQPRLGRHQLGHRRGLVEEPRRRARGQLRGHGLHAPPRQPLHAEQAGVDRTM